MSDEYLEPTLTSRLLLILLICCVGLLAAALKLWLLPALFQHVRSLPLCGQLPWWRALLLCVLGSLPIMALLCAMYGLKLIGAGQMPLPGTWVLRRTRIRRGAAVRLRAQTIFAFAGILIVVSGIGAYMLLQTPFFKSDLHCGSAFKLRHIPPGLAFITFRQAS